MVDDTKKCLLVGLPNAGKTSYLAAFWAIEKEGKSGHKVYFHKYPENLQHLESIKTSWLRQEKVDRTSADDECSLELPLESRDSKNRITLVMPDFKGENFSNILSENPSEEIVKWVDDADCIMFFVELLKPDILSDDLPISVESKLEKPISMVLSDISLTTRNIMLLQYLATRIDRNTPLAICFSAWDKITGDYENVENWLDSKYHFMKNFIDYHFDNVKYFGVSAQGREYKKDDEDAIIEEFEEKTRKNQRAYVFTDHVDNDITLPLDFLINA